MGNAGVHDVAVQRLEAEFGASGGKGLNNARDVVADEDKACHAAVSLHGTPQGILGVLHDSWSMRTL